MSILPILLYQFTLYWFQTCRTFLQTSQSWRIKQCFLSRAELSGFYFTKWQYWGSFDAVWTSIRAIATATSSLPVLLPSSGESGSFSLRILCVNVLRPTISEGDIALECSWLAPLTFFSLFGLWFVRGRFLFGEAGVQVGCGNLKPMVDVSFVTVGLIAVKECRKAALNIGFGADFTSNILGIDGARGRDAFKMVVSISASIMMLKCWQAVVNAYEPSMIVVYRRSCLSNCANQKL